jgi:hypothetical protein
MNVRNECGDSAADSPHDCPRTRALLEQIKGFGYSAADDRCTSLCWDLERENTDLRNQLNQQRAKGLV